MNMAGSQFGVAHVIPAQAGIHWVPSRMDPGVRRDDGTPSDSVDGQTSGASR